MVWSVIFAAIAATNLIGGLEPVTVFGSRIGSDKAFFACKTDIISSDEIKSSRAVDLPDLLSKKSLVNTVSMNGTPHLRSISLRGFGDYGFGRVKIALGSEILNNVDMSEPNLTRIALDDIDRVELLHGPSSVLYGDGAVAGVVKIVEDDGRSEPFTKLSLKSGSCDTYAGAFSTRQLVDDVMYKLSYGYRKSGGFRDRTAYDMHTMNASVKRFFMNESFVGFKVNFQNAFYELPGALTFEEWKASRKKAKYGGDWARLWSFAGAFNSKIKLSDTAVLYVDGGFSKQYRHAVYRSSLSDLEFDYYSYSFTPRYVNDKDVFGRRNRFAAGIDLFYDDFRENHPLSWGSKGVKRAFERLRNAYYVHDEFSLTDEISLSAGARLEMIHNRFNGYSSVREHSGTDIMDDYELGVAYRPKDGLKLYAKGSVFHRSAFCDEMSYTKSGNLLEPETGFSFDAGFEWDILENLNFSVDAYAMRMKDEIFFDSTLLPFGYNSNCGENTQRFGFDAMLSYEKEEEFSFSVGYGAVKAEIDGGGFGDIPFVPNHRVRSEFGVFAAEGLEVKIGFSYIGQKYLSGDYKNEGERLKGYALFDFGVYYEPKWLDGVNISFSVNNLFDRSYCDYAAYIAPPGSPCYYPSAGRVFLFGVSYEF